MSRSEKLVFPGCCPDSEKMESIFISVNVYDEENQEPYWCLDLSSRTTGHRWSLTRWVNPSFCPYCGSKLPGIRKRVKPVSPVCKVVDGGYYCDTCKNRLHACSCYMPAWAWEPDR